MDDPDRPTAAGADRRRGRARGPGRADEQPVPPGLRPWGEALGRRPDWPVVAVAAVVITAIVAGPLLVWPTAAPARRCGPGAGAGACRAAAGRLTALPPGGTPGGHGLARPVRSPPRPRARRASPDPRSPAPVTPVTSASVPPAPITTTPGTPVTTAPAGPAVTVSYNVVKVWDGGFQGEFTIVNHGAAPVDGWQLTAVLPGDQVQSAWDAGFQASGDTVTLTPPSYQVVIEPGASLAEHFTAGGADTVPRSCAFNGAPCS